MLASIYTLMLVLAGPSRGHTGPRPGAETFNLYFLATEA